MPAGGEIMRRSLIALGTVAALAGGPPPAGAHHLTEKYIPVGVYSNVEGRNTTLGTIDSVDRDARIVTIATGNGKKTAQIDDDTRIWLDRSPIKKKNLDGGFGDLLVGSMAEMKTLEGEPPRCAWIKVRITQ